MTRSHYTTDDPWPDHYRQIEGRYAAGEDAEFSDEGRDVPPGYAIFVVLIFMACAAFVGVMSVLAPNVFELWETIWGAL